MFPFLSTLPDSSDCRKQSDHIRDSTPITPFNSPLMRHCTHLKYSYFGWLLWAASERTETYSSSASASRKQQLLRRSCWLVEKNVLLRGRKWYDRRISRRRFTSGLWIWWIREAAVAFDVLRRARVAASVDHSDGGMVLFLAFFAFHAMFRPAELCLSMGDERKNGPFVEDGPHLCDRMLCHWSTDLVVQKWDLLAAMATKEIATVGFILFKAKKLVDLSGGKLQFQKPPRLKLKVFGWAR